MCGRVLTGDDWWWSRVYGRDNVATKKSCRKSCTPTGFWQKPKLCNISIQRQCCVRGLTFKKQVQASAEGSSGGEYACPATWLVSDFGVHGIPLIKKASVGPTRAQQVHHVWATKTLCGPRIVRMRRRGKLSVHAPDHRESAERHSSCDRCYRDYSAQPREGNNNDITSMQQQ